MRETPSLESILFPNRKPERFSYETKRTLAGLAGLVFIVLLLVGIPYFPWYVLSFIDWPFVLVWAMGLVGFILLAGIGLGLGTRIFDFIYERRW